MRALCATGARASRQSPLLGALDPPYCTVPLYSINPSPSRQRTPHLPFHSMLEPARLVPVFSSQASPFAFGCWFAYCLKELFS